MPINLRVGLRFARQATLARRYEGALSTLERIVQLAPPRADSTLGRLWQRITTEEKLYHMKRSFIRHPRAYRFKANLAVLWASISAMGDLLVLLPMLVLSVLTLGLWLFVARSGAFAEEVEAYLARCEFEDISDEIERRLRRRKA